MYIDEYDFTHQDQTLLRDMPEEIICHNCQEPFVSIVFLDHGDQETFNQSFQLAPDHSCTIPIYDILVDYFEHYQTDQFKGDMLIFEGQTQAADWQVDIINSILHINNLPNDICFTSDFADALSISTNASSLTVTITDQYSGATLLSSTYFPYQEVVEIFDLGSLIESFMLARGLTCNRFLVTLKEPLTTVTHTIFSIFCQQRVSDISAKNFVDQSFLTNNTSRFTSPDVEEVLPLIVGTQIGTKTIVYELSGTFLLPNGELQTYAFLSTRNYASQTYFALLDVSYKTVKGQLRQVYPPADGELLYYTIAIGDRRCTFYVTQARVTRSFLFRNSFNCWETMHLFTSTTTKLESNFSTAVCGDRLTHYNVEHTRTFEEQTSSLRYAQAIWLQEFLSSPDIRLLIGSAFSPNQQPQVLIKSYTSEPTNAPSDSANALNFEWQYSSRRGYMSLNRHNGIFTEQFTSPFR